MELRTSTLQLAADPKISAEELDELLDLAAGPRRTGSYPTLLEARLRDALAANPSCPEDVKEDLIIEPHVFSARHLSAGPDLLEYLSKHERADVRAAVAENRRTPASVLLKLCTDEMPVVASAASNLSCPSLGLLEAWNHVLKLGGGQECDPAIDGIAQHPNSPSDVLLQIIQMCSMEQAAAAVSNPALESLVLSSIMDDDSAPEELRLLAARNLNNPYCQAMLQNVCEAALGTYWQLIDRGVDPMTAASVVGVGIVGGSE